MKGGRRETRRLRVSRNRNCKRWRTLKQLPKYPLFYWLPATITPSMKCFARGCPGCSGAVKTHSRFEKNEALQNALQKFTTSPNGLTVPDLKALVTATTNGSEKDVLQQLLYCEP
jgi:hypothetical protein